MFSTTSPRLDVLYSKARRKTLEATSAFSALASRAKQTMVGWVICTLPLRSKVSQAVVPEISSDTPEMMRLKGSAIVLFRPPTYTNLPEAQPLINQLFCLDNAILNGFSGSSARRLRSAISGHHRGGIVGLTRQELSTPNASKIRAPTANHCRSALGNGAEGIIVRGGWVHCVGVLLIHNLPSAGRPGFASRRSGPPPEPSRRASG